MKRVWERNKTLVLQMPVQKRDEMAKFSPEVSSLLVRAKFAPIVCILTLH
jgi:hypothetical protein